MKNYFHNYRFKIYYAVKRLKDDFIRKGISYHKLYQDEEIVAYSLAKMDNEWFEVFRYKIRKPNKFIDDEYEVYPSNEDFGVWAWSCSNLETLILLIKY